MRFVSFVCFVAVTVLGLSVQNEFQSPQYQLGARDDSVKQLKVANDILATINKFSEKGTSTPDSNLRDSEPSVSKKNVPSPRSQPVTPNAATPIQSPKQKAKTVAASVKSKFIDFIKVKLSALLAKAKALAKSKAQQQINKAKQATAKKLSPPPKREVIDSDSSHELEARSLIDNVMTQVFVALKRSGLINYVIRLSLTDAEVRAGVADITIELIRADVIPYQEVFHGLQQSGLALDVVKFSLTDAETRLGLVDLLMELVPQLVEICGPGVLSNADFGFAAVSLTVSPVAAATGSVVA